MATSRSEVLSKLEAAAEGVIGLGDRLTLAESIVAEFVGSFPTNSGPDGAAAAPEVEGWELDSMLDRARRFLGSPGLLDDGEDAPTRDPVACPEVGDIWRESDGTENRVALVAVAGTAVVGAWTRSAAGGHLTPWWYRNWTKFTSRCEYAGNVGAELEEADDA